MSPMKLCVPGDKLCSTEDCIPGTGVYLRHGYIYSSLAGYVLRKNEGEEVETYKSFRPGDIVLAKVISLGDVQSNYLLTTAENELGVVVAHSEAGAQMVPISWCEMQCPQTHAKEFRKVARVQPEYLQA
ncbi:exosome complex component CSL4 isoform X3 [Echeneis naucrates]|uniref:exosome complex component CSL4 isoform X3 n=1 Tax=Echeneis naucrates TaxID=173247 RepID=UPI001113B816|nr:exosome complex component CSL4 isoform X3 [Echeneis naucrates]